MSMSKEMYASVLRYFQELNSLKEVFSSIACDSVLLEKTIHNLYQSFIKEDVFFPYYMERFEQYGDSFMDRIFTEENLNRVVHYLQEHGLTMLEVQQAIADNPGLLVLASSLEKLLVAFYDGKYYGLVISDENMASSYYALPVDFEKNKNLSLHHSFSENTYLVKTLSRFLSREDSCNLYDIEEEDTLASRLTKMKNKNDSVQGFKIR